jgi:hypothetical protein
MNSRINLLIAALLVVAIGGVGVAADLTTGMQKGTPDIKSAGPITFAPGGILLVGDTTGAAVFAIVTGDKPAGSPSQSLNVEKVDEKIAGLLGTSPQQILINDMAVNPETKSTFLSVSRGKGPEAKPAIVRVDSSGELGVFSTNDVMYSKAPLPGAAMDSEGKGKQDVTTDLQFADGKIIVAGLSNEEFGSQLRVIPFPFASVEGGASVEIWHTAHGKFETKSPVRTFAVFEVKGQPNVLAAYTCTPLVRFPLSDLKPGSKVKGETIAELGNRNKPLDMIVYNKEGKDYLLLANSARGVMKVNVEPIDKTQGLTDRVTDGKSAGLPYETIKDLGGLVQQLDKLDKDHAILLVQSEAGAKTLKAIQLP